LDEGLWQELSLEERVKRLVNPLENTFIHELNYRFLVERTIKYVGRAIFYQFLAS